MKSCGNKKYVLITGASSGVGRATSVALSEHYNIVIHGRDIEKLEKTKALCSKLADVKIWQLDFSVADEVEESLKTFLNTNEIMIASYIHSAGMTGMIPLKTITIDKIQKILNTNFISAALITKTLLQKKNNGTELENIIYISSNISNCGGKAFAAYAASKGALDSFMRCAAVELAPRTRVNSILPGGMLTEMTKEIFDDEELIKRMVSAYPMGMGKPEDIAGVVKFLLSEESKWITGQQITVDGGRSINISG